MADRTELPRPFYAAAGAGELAYQQLRKLPEAAARTVRTAGETAGQWRIRLAGDERQLADRLRESAERGRTVVRSRATAAQQRAVTGYHNLVARGQRVVSERTGRDGEQAQVEVIVGPVQSANGGGPADTGAGPATDRPA